MAEKDPPPEFQIAPAPVRRQIFLRFAGLGAPGRYVGDLQPGEGLIIRTTHTVKPNVLQLPVTIIEEDDGEPG